VLQVESGQSRGDSAPKVAEERRRVGDQLGRSRGTAGERKRFHCVGGQNAAFARGRALYVGFKPINAQTYYSVSGAKL
jgi:hypothetical protein